MEATAQNTITDNVKTLHTARVEAANLKDEIAKLQEAFQIEHADLFDKLAWANSRVSSLESTVRVQAVEAYQTNPTSKAVCPGVGIRVMTRYEYEQNRALNWALEHKMCLALDKRAFENICKADTSKPDFVVVQTEPTATIATDLSLIVLADQ